MIIQNPTTFAFLNRESRYDGNDRAEIRVISRFLDNCRNTDPQEWNTLNEPYFLQDYVTILTQGATGC